MAYNTLTVELSEGVLNVSLNRPGVHNAFNDELIAEAIDVFSNIDAASARAIVLQGAGKTFCAGADLNWMSRMVAYTRDENVRDSSLLAKMFAIVDECPLPIVGRIQG
ncbi:MAG TPA: enoyl-CoA hydratase-related protein, partial [Thermoanaerobaculia bacterium]|nr:enoyl-CoA hydratase-related protein [Thermoanaerobaculia bacterium]